MVVSSIPYASSELLQAFRAANVYALSAESCLTLIELMFQLCCGDVYPDMEVSIEQARLASQNAKLCAERGLEAVYRDDLVEAQRALEDATIDKQKALDALSHMFKRFTLITENTTRGRIRLSHDDGFVAVWSETCT